MSPSFAIEDSAGAWVPHGRFVLRGAGASDAGRQREVNEDRYYCGADGAWPGVR